MIDGQLLRVLDEEEMMLNNWPVLEL